MWVVAANGIALSVRAIIIPTIAMAMRNEKRYVFGVSDVGIYPAVGANRQRGGVLAMRQKHVAVRTIILA